MNFIFVSPHFPKTYWNFCDRLHRNGVNVLGIGDAPFDEIPWELKQCLTEYYRVNDLGNYDEMLRAVAYFTFHYGKIDWIESNNEYWLEMDAQLRTDFNINTGAKNDFIERIKYKSKMKESYIAAGVPVARYHIVSTLAEARAFIKEVGYPVIVKPDNGCGAEATYKLRNFTELKEFYAEPTFLSSAVTDNAKRMRPFYAGSHGSTGCPLPFWGTAKGPRWKKTCAATLACRDRRATARPCA